MTTAPVGTMPSIQRGHWYHTIHNTMLLITNTLLATVYQLLCWRRADIISLIALVPYRSLVPRDFAVMLTLVWCSLYAGSQHLCHWDIYANMVATVNSCVETNVFRAGRRGLPYQKKKKKKYRWLH